jgi:hypothetical protein
MSEAPAPPREKPDKLARTGLVSAAAPRPSLALEAAASVAGDRALLSLTALPGTQVSVGGHQYAVPVSGLSLPAGRYQVIFNNITWDGPVSTQIVLLPGKSSRVHADFTNEPPRIVVR